MSLFAHRQEYQRSIDRIFEDCSVQSRVQTESSREKVENNSHRSVISLGNQQQRYVQHKIQNDMTPQVAAGYEFIQYDIKAWGCFLDSKHKD